MVEAEEVAEEEGVEGAACVLFHLAEVIDELTIDDFGESETCFGE